MKRCDRLARDLAPPEPRGSVERALTVGRGVFTAARGAEASSSDQALEHGIARVLRDPHAAQEGQVADVEVAGAPAEQRGVERDHDRLAAARLGARARSSRRGRPTCSSRAGTSAGRRRARRPRAPSGRTPGSRTPSARPALAAARAMARSASRVRHLERRRSAPGGTARRGAARTARRDVSRARDVAQHARHDPPTREGVAVRAHRGPGPRAAGDVGERLRTHDLLGGGLEAGEVGGDARPAPEDSVQVDLLLPEPPVHPRRVLPGRPRPAALDTLGVPVSPLPIRPGAPEPGGRRLARVLARRPDRVAW